MTAHLRNPTKRAVARLTGRWRPYLIIAIIAFAVQALLVSLDSFEWFFTFSRDHETLELDEIFTVFIVLSLALIAVLVLRTGELRHEIRRRQMAETHAGVLARFDSLTGVPNRRLYHEELAARIGRARTVGAGFSALLLDLDRFKTVNDTYGHATGDLLLQTVSDRLRANLRPEDFLARLGGDEFAVLMDHGATGTEPVLRVAQRILASVDQPFSLGAVETRVSVSIGIAGFTGDAEDAETLMQRADLAMYQAKSAGRNTYAVFDPALDSTLRARISLEAELRLALRVGGIRPHYQPLYDLATGRLTGFEALARWEHPERGLLQAETFVPIAEDAGLLPEIFPVILAHVVRDARLWPPDLSIAINTSPSQLRDRDFARRVLNVLGDAGFPPARLEIEITETALVNDLDAARDIMITLKEAGVRVSLDDFGTGYSSLRHLRELPFDKIKIDRSFVHRLDHGEDSEKIVRSMIQLSQALGLISVAEGIETDGEADWLRAQGCDMGQGFLFSQALPASEATDLLAALRSPLIVPT
ncbi:EAL domain-containing protein [Paroceanicella profunda]|uniref:EAL domain-containing protein n=1 Tax=Paroceanicella profunda TaxID=2579971 RepID=A0A5B8FTJ3_9RHOB|nr:EAL domain-containing protein [Paroceanicella profunda]QDL91685.1 EAL domain-containing protein [Paroceanicella profunda]